MRFKWRRRLAVTAFALSLMLPFAGCSSQQQQASDEVAAEGQGGQEEGGQQSETAAAQAQGGENAEGGEATAQAAPDNAAPAEGESSGGGENVVSNDAAAPAEEGADAEAQALSGEINASAEGQASAEQPAADVATAEAGGETAAPAEGAAAEGAATAAAPAAAAPAEAAAPGLPQMNSKMAYVVEAGDTLGKIATKIYGDQKRWRDIANLSGMSNPNHIYPGDVVYYTLEDSSRNFASAYESIKRAKEIVREGDTLAAISKRVYGTSKAWRHIWRQNDNIDNPDQLTAGMPVYYVEKGAFSVALNKVKAIEVAKVQKLDATKGFKAAGSGKKSNTVVKVPVFMGKSV